MNHRIFMNVATNMIDHVFTQPSTVLMSYLQGNHSSVPFFFSGMDITHGCMPNKFSHILFGKLRNLSGNVDHLYRGDRIYIKPEEYGLQQFQHYLARKCITFVSPQMSTFLVYRLRLLYSSGITLFSVPIR
jgi:hypothetical protein